MPTLSQTKVVMLNFIAMFASMFDQLKLNAQTGWDLGSQGDLSGLKQANNLAQGAFTLLFVLIILAVTALVGGEFISAIPATGPFGDAITDMENNASTAMLLFAVGLLIIPAAALIAYLYQNLGGMMGAMSSGGMRR